MIKKVLMKMFNPYITNIFKRIFIWINNSWHQLTVENKTEYITYYDATGHLLTWNFNLKVAKLEINLRIVFLI